MTGTERLWIFAAGASGAAAVAMGAAGRHLLAGDAYRQDLATTAAHYGLAHAIALLGVAALSMLRGAPRASRRALAGAGWCFTAGLVLFPGGLYLRAAGLLPGTAPAIPIGGSLLIAGWLALAGAAVLAWRRCGASPAGKAPGQQRAGAEPERDEIGR